MSEIKELKAPKTPKTQKEPKEPKPPKTQKVQKAPKTPKAPKEPKEPKAQKAPKTPKAQKEPKEPKAPKEPKMKNLWKVTLKFGFKRTNRSYDQKPWPTIEEINKYMLKDKKYKMYIESLFLYDGYNQKPKNITFKNGIATFYIDPTVLEVWDKVPMFPTVDKLSYYLEHINLADGLWEGMPGSPGVYPVDSTNKEEFGVINFGDIVIQPV